MICVSRKFLLFLFIFVKMLLEMPLSWTDAYLEL
jgi:hypothetical protein